MNDTLKTSPSSVEIQHLCFRYPDGTPALNDVSASIQPGEAVALIGGNGTGKSTLLLHLAGVLRSVPPAILINQQKLNKQQLKEVRKTVGMIFQNPDDQLFMPTVFEDVCFGPLNANVSAELVEQRAVKALEQVGLLHLRDRLPSHLSSGEKRRVTIAGILAMDVGLLLMDEPASSLDPRSRRHLIHLLKTLGQTKLIATHDLEFAVETCERAIVLNGGKSWPMALSSTC